MDRHAIKAEVHRRGETLTSLAIKAGLNPSACRQGLLGVSRPGAEVIAEFIGVPFRELFPTLYFRMRHSEKNTIATHTANQQKQKAQ